MKLLLDKSTARLVLNSIENSISHMSSDFRHEDDIIQLKMVKAQLEILLIN